MRDRLVVLLFYITKTGILLWNCSWNLEYLISVNTLDNSIESSSSTIYSTISPIDYKYMLQFRRRLVVRTFLEIW